MEPQPPEAVFVGAVTFDAIALVGHMPGADERVVARQIAWAGGGPAATAAVAAARLGVRTAVVGAVGDDEEGRLALDALRREGVGVEHVRVETGRQTQTSVVVCSSASAARAICTRAVTPLDLAAGDDQTSGDGVRGALSTASWVHADHLGWPALRALGVRRSTNGDGPRLSVDAGNPVPGLAPGDVDLYVPTVESLRARYAVAPDGPGSEVEALLDRALAEGAGRVVATDGSRGSFAVTVDGQRVSAPAHRVDVVSTLGAGDVFHGALVAAMVHRLPLDQALRYANVTAALACRAVDGRSAIPSHDEVFAVMGGVLDLADERHDLTITSS